MKKRIFSPIGLGLALATLGSVVTQGPVAMAQTEAVWYNCLTREVFTPEKQAWCDRWQTLQNTAYQVPADLDADLPEYFSLLFSNGRFQQADGPMTAQLVNQQGWMAFGDVNGDGKDDAAVIFGVSADSRGSQVGTYLTAVLDIDGAARALTPVKLGERSMLNGPITIGNLRINVPLLAQESVVNRTYVTDDSSVSELAQLPGPVAPEGSSGSSGILPGGTIVFSQTPRYAVRIYAQGEQLRLNLFDKTTGLAELTGASVTVETTDEGVIYSALTQGSTPSVQVQIANSGVQTLTVNGTVVPSAAQVTGSVTYRPRIALPDNAVVEVSLVDVSRADAPAVVLASQSGVTNGRQVPIAFALSYDPGQIDARYSYAVQARITVDGQLRFINTSRYGVITQGHPTQIEVVVDPVSR